MFGVSSKPVGGRFPLNTQMSVDSIHLDSVSNNMRDNDVNQNDWNDSPAEDPIPTQVRNDTTYTS